jgi:hypothetical protein
MYKIILDENVIDVVKVPHFFRVLPTGHITFTDKTSAQGIVGSNNKTLYAFSPLANKELDIVTIEEIAIDEFNRLKSLLNSDSEQNIAVSELKKARQIAINRISSFCKSKITDGFSIKLSDGATYNFKLTTEDQLNLLLLENQLSAGCTSFLYHATNQPCRFFSREDMTRIIAAFKRYVEYHTTYFNVAKQYINSQTDLDKVNKFTYGTDVSSIVADPVIKRILKNGGNLV